MNTNISKSTKSAERFDIFRWELNPIHTGIQCSLIRRIVSYQLNRENSGNKRHWERARLCDGGGVAPQGARNFLDGLRYVLCLDIVSVFEGGKREGRNEKRCPDQTDWHQPHTLASAFFNFFLFLSQSNINNISFYLLPILHWLSVLKADKVDENI